MNEGHGDSFERSGRPAMWRTSMPGLLWYESVQPSWVLPVQEFPRLHIPFLLRVLQAPLFHSGECSELCLVQEVYGSEALHEDVGEDGLPVHLWHLAGWPVWSCSNQAQGNFAGRSSW